MTAGAAIGQLSVHFGIEAGVPLTDTLISSSESSTSQSPAYQLFNRFNSKTKRLLIGPTLRVETPSGIGFEVDALYQRVDSDFSALLVQPSAPAEQTLQLFQQTTANRWQFPVQVQYSRKVGSLRWFAGAGPSLSHMRQILPEDTTPFPLGSLPSSATWGGITAGGGVDVRASRLHLRPELRYSHWFAGSGAIVPRAAVIFRGNFIPARSPAGLAAPFGFFFPIHREEVSFFLGVTF